MEVQTMIGIWPMPIAIESRLPQSDAWECKLADQAVDRGLGGPPHFGYQIYSLAIARLS
jgi:hypothetical protein